MNSPAQNRETETKGNRPICRIGLISPCLGNLGNAAILSSMIANIRERMPDAEIVGITLSPEDTRRRHGIEAFPITRIFRKNYSLPFSSADRVQGRSAGKLRPAWLSIKEWLKRVPLLRPLVRGIRSFATEIIDIVQTERFVRGLQRVIVTGGGALDEFWGGPWGHPWTLFKFAVLSRLCHVPFLFVSVGKCSVERPLSRFFVRSALRMAEYRSYRDADSKTAVQALLRSPGDPVCADLAYCFPCQVARRPQSRSLQDQSLLVGVSPMAWCDPRVWPIKDEQRYSRYLGHLADMVAWLLQQRNRVLLFATDNPDNDNIADLQRLLSLRSVDSSLLQVIPGPPQQTTEGFLEAISATDLVIASRLHGVILSHLIAVPVLAISYDRKVDAHMHDIGQSAYCLDIDHLDAESLVSRFVALRDARARESARIASAVQRYREQVRMQYDQLFGAAEHISPAPASDRQLITAVEP